VSIRGVTRSTPDLHALIGKLGFKASQLKIEKSRDGTPSGFASVCIANLTEQGVQLLKSQQVMCAGADSGMAHFRVFATLDKLVPKCVEYGTSTVMDPALARAQLVQFAIEKDMWLTQAMEICYGDPNERGAARFATLLQDGAKVRIGPRRLLGIQNGVSTHDEDSSSRKTIARTNPELTVFTKCRVEIRASNWKLLEAIQQVAEALAAHRTSDSSLPPHMAAMVPFGSEAIEAYRRSETSVKIDFGTMEGITINAVYDLTVGLAQVVHVSIQELKDVKGADVVLTRTIVKVTSIDKEGAVRMCSLNGYLYESLGAISQVLKVETWLSNELALVPADLREFSMTISGKMARLGDQSGEYNPLAMLREMDTASLRESYAPHARQKAHRLTELQNDISAVQEKKLADQHGIAYRMPIGQHSLVLIREKGNPHSDLTYKEIVYHGQTIFDWVGSVIRTNVDEDDPEWSSTALASCNGQIPEDCIPGPHTIYRARGLECIGLKAAILTQMRDHMARIEIDQGPQVIYAVVDFMGQVAPLAAKKMLRMNRGPESTNTTVESPGPKKVCAPEDVLAEYLKAQLQRAAVITSAFPPDVKAECRRLAADALNGSKSGGAGIVTLLDYIDNDPDQGAGTKHPLLSQYDVGAVTTAMEMAIAEPFDKSGGADMYDSGSRVGIINRIPGDQLRRRTALVFSYFGEYTNALNHAGPATPIIIADALNLTGDKGGIVAALTSVYVFRHGSPAHRRSDSEYLGPSVRDELRCNCHAGSRRGSRLSGRKPWCEARGAAGGTNAKLTTVACRIGSASASWISSAMNLLGSDMPPPSAALALLTRLINSPLGSHEQCLFDFLYSATRTFLLWFRALYDLVVFKRHWNVLLPNLLPPWPRVRGPLHLNINNCALGSSSPDYLEIVRTRLTYSDSRLKRFPLLQKLITVWGLAARTADRITLSLSWAVRTTLGLLSSYRLTILATYAMSPSLDPRLLPQPAAIVLMAVLAWRQGGISADLMRTVLQMLSRLVCSVTYTIQAGSRSHWRVPLLMFTLLAWPASAWETESAFTSVSFAALPASFAAAESYDCAGRWVETMGDAGWDDLQHNHGNEEYWNQMGWDDNYYGDALLERSRSTGLRIIAQNTGRRLFKAEQPTPGLTKLSLLVAKMTVDSVDIAVFHEPGMYRKTDNSIALEIGKSWRHVAVRRTAEDAGGGLLVIYKASIEPAVLQSMRSSQLLQAECDSKSKAGARYDSDRLVTMELANPLLSKSVKGGAQRRDRLLLVLVYGYNTTADSASAAGQWGANEQAQVALLTDTRGVINRFRSKYPKASIILAGDLNCADHVELDSLEAGTTPDSLGRTNYDADLNLHLPGHTMMATLRDMGLQGSFREHHPYTKAITRWPQGAQKGSPKRLDAIWMTQELIDEVSSRSGIKREDDVLGSDHRMHYVDVCLDVANQAENRQVLWSRTKETKLTPLRNLSAQSPEVLAYQDKLRNWEPEMHLTHRVTNLAEGPPASDSDWDNVMNEEFRMMNKEMVAAGVGTILQRTVVISPNFISKIPDMTALDWNHFLRRRRLRALEDAITMRLGGAEIDRRLSRIPEPTPITIQSGKHKGELVPQYSGESLAQARSGSLHQLRAKALRDVAQLNKWLDSADRKQRNTESRQRSEETRAQFVIGKVSRTVKSVFHKHRALKEKVWLTDKVGALISAPEAVSEYVAEFLKDWMATKAPLISRFKDIDAALDWDLDGMTPEHRQTVDTFYGSGGKDRHYYADKEELWDGSLDPVASQELESAINSFTTGKATGPSQVPIDLFKWMPAPLRSRVQQFLSECVRRRRFPPEANAAKMWLVPKNEEGLTDLGQTRPIALMETVCKIYERILCDRILKTMMDNDMIDRCQHGSIPEGTTTDAMFNLAGVLDDARSSGQSLFLLSLDLSKAFDTLEYWSQAMTWRAFGMPKDLIKILLQMDETATTQVALGGGRYTAPVPHGRGVRQGSCGGPLKWIAFMHWWMAGTKARMAGKGYKMSADPDTEFIAQMFVDDSNWATNSAEAMQEMVKLHEEWVSLHALGINKKKTDLLVVNPGTDDSLVEWADGLELTPVPCDRPVRYLGAHFQTGGGWEGESEILRTKLRERLDPLRTRGKHCSIAQVRYLINGVIMPALLHPLKVAVIPWKVLRDMDSQIASSFFRATNMAVKDTPREMAHLPVNMGGWGIQSVEMQRHALCVSMWSMALNRGPDHMTRRIADALIRAHKRRYRIAANPLNPNDLRHARQGSQLAGLGSALETLNLTLLTTDQGLCNPLDSHRSFDMFQKKPSLTSPEEAAVMDRDQMSEAPRRGQVRAFTDGSLSDPTHLSSQCGWGYYITWGSEGASATGCGRVMSVPTIFEAESEAVMRALLSISPQDTVEIFIDNMSVLELLQGTILRPWQDNTASTLNSPGRATWERIRRIVRHRASQGTGTTASWIHSHVDQEGRLEVKCTTHKCACHRDSPEGTTKCNPSHWAHLGNVEADIQADRGPDTQGPIEKWKGELRAFPAPTGEHITGHKLKDVLETAVHGSLFRRAKGKVRAQRLQEMNLNTDHTMRLRAAKKTTKGCTERFQTRANMDILPTYARLAKAVHGNGDNRMRRMYTPEGEADPIIDEDGLCMLCGTAPENLAHVLFDCPLCSHMIFMRERRHTEALAIAHSYGLQDWWVQEDWTIARPGWNPVWGAMGQAPRDVWKTAIAHGANQETLPTCIATIQDVMLSSATKLWTQRNELVQNMEKEYGVTESKLANKAWIRPPSLGGQAVKRGRPQKQWEDLAFSTRSVKRRANDSAELDHLHPDPCKERELLKAAQKRMRSAEAARDALGTLGPLAAPGEGIDPVTKGMETLRRYDSTHTRRAQCMGIGTRVSISWPNEKGSAAKRWHGSVIALIPNWNGTSDHVVRYSGSEDEHYRHALWAGLTAYSVVGEACAPDCTASCQQGKDDCECDAHEHSHSHPWFEKNSTRRALCDCATCVAAGPYLAEIIRTSREAGAQLPAGKKYRRGPRKLPTSKNSLAIPNADLGDVDLEIPDLDAAKLTADADATGTPVGPATSKARRDMERGERAAKRARGKGHAAGRSSEEDASVWTAQDPADPASGSFGGGCDGPPQDAGSRGIAGGAPATQEPHQVGTAGAQSDLATGVNYTEAQAMDHGEHADRKADHSECSAEPVQKATQRSGRLPTRPHARYQGPAAAHGVQGRAHDGPRGQRPPKSVLRRPELGGTSGSLGPHPGTRGYCGRVPRRPRKDGARQGEHRPAKCPRLHDDSLGGWQRGPGSARDTCGGSGDTVPYVDPPRRDLKAGGEQLQAQVRETEHFAPSKGSGGQRADGAGTERGVVHFRLDLPGSVYGSAEVLLAGKWGVGEAWRTDFHGSSARASSTELLHVQNSTARDFEVPDSEGHKDMDQPPGMEAEILHSLGTSPESAGGEIGKQAPGSGNVQVGDQEVDTGGADMGLAVLTQAQAAHGLIRRRGPQLDTQQIAQQQAQRKKRRLEAAAWERHHRGIMDSEMAQQPGSQDPSRGTPQGSQVEDCMQLDEP